MFVEYLSIEDKKTHVHEISIQSRKAKKIEDTRLKPWRLLFEKKIKPFQATVLVHDFYILLSCWYLFSENTAV